MKKALLSLIVILTMCFSVDVFASTTYSEDSSSETFKTLKSNFDAATKSKISGSGMATIYAKAVCTNGSWNITYAGGNGVKDALSNTVICTNGEKYINAGQYTSGGETYTRESSCSSSVTAYFNMEYPVTCTNTSGSNAIEANGNKNSSGGTSGSTEDGSNAGSSNSGSSNSGSGSTNGNGSSNGNYSSSGTVNNESTGVNTYFVVLGLVAGISYIFMLCVKKYNLFKNI